MDLSAAAGNLAAGIASMNRAGLSTDAAGGHALSPAGYHLASALGQIVTTGGVALSVARGDVPFAVAHLTVFRTSLAIWIAAWTQVSAGAAAVDLLEVSGSGALQLVGSLLNAQGLAQLPEPPKDLAQLQCVACREPLQEGAVFCDHCGRRVAAATPAEQPCPNPECGRPIPTGKNFCTACGTPAVVSHAMR